MEDNSSSGTLTLEDYNDLEISKRTSAIVYLSVVMSLGIPGNLLVIIIYFGSLRRRTGTHWMYIRALAITDFLVCVIAIPFEIFQQTHQLTFYSEAGCKIFRSVSVHLSLTSSLLLIAMSGNRLRKVCQPLKKQLSYKGGLIGLGIIVGISGLFCWPEGVISGISIEKLENNITGYDCSFSDRFTGKDYGMIYSTVLLTVYLTCMVALVIMYSIVGKEVLKRAKFQERRKSACVAHSCSNETNKSTVIENISDTIDDDESDEKRDGIKMAAVKPQIAIVKQTKAAKCKCSKCSADSRKGASKKVTRIAFAISFCFILSYLPYVAVKLNASVVKGRFVVTPLTKAIFPILARTYILNNIINPVIYGFLDTTFSQQLKLLFKHVFCLKCRHGRQ